MNYFIQNNRTIIIYLVILTTSLFGQKTANKKYNIVLREYKPEVYHENTSEKLSFPDFYDVSHPGTPNLPSQNFFIALPPGAKIKKLNLSNIEYDTMKDVLISGNPKAVVTADDNLEYKENPVDLNFVRSNIYPSVDISIIGYKWLGGFYVAVINVNNYKYDFIKKNLQITQSADIELEYEYTNFVFNNTPLSLFESTLKEIILNFNEAVEFRSAPDINTISKSDWIDYSSSYVKLGIAEDGIYKIDYEFLQMSGVNPNVINPVNLKVYSEGAEIPIFVFGEDDLVFDESDYILLFAEKNYSREDYRKLPASGEEYIPYIDKYSDTSYVWLNWTGSAGKRVMELPNESTSAIDTITQHVSFHHLESDERFWYNNSGTPQGELPFEFMIKTWTGKTIGNGRNVSYYFLQNNILPDQIAEVYIRLISHAANITQDAHSFSYSMNSGSALDTSVFNFRKTANLFSSFNTDELKQGNNGITIIGNETSALFHQALIDWIEIEIPVQNVIENDSLKLKFPDDFKDRYATIQISSVDNPEDYEFWKVKPIAKRLNVNFVSGNIFFNDSVSGDSEYLILSNSKLKTPQFTYSKRFVNLNDKNNGADYIIISNKVLEESVTEYAEFINSSYELRTQIAWVDDIYDEFGFGHKSAEAIKEFINTAYSTWVVPKPSYILIVGDANYDYRHVVSPVPFIKEDLVPSYGTPVSDSWYTTLSDSLTDLPQMYIGRIPAMDNEEVINYLNKHKSYISREFDNWNKTFLLFTGGNDQDPDEVELLKSINDDIQTELIDPAPVGGKSFHFYKTYNPLGNLGPYSQEEFNNIVAEGGLFISYIGHSGTRTWDNGITEVENLKSDYDDRNPLISDFGCSTGKFAEPDVEAFGELFTSRNENSEAIAYLGNTSFGFLSTALVVPNLFYSKFLKDFELNIGQAHALSKIELLKDYGYSDVNRVYNYCNVLLGDPVISLRLPDKPNLNIVESGLNVKSDELLDVNDSAYFQLTYSNFGFVNDDSLEISIKDEYLGSIIFNSTRLRKMPNLNDTLLFSIPIEFKSGLHSVSIVLDPDNKVDELNENDNQITIPIKVNSSSFRPLLADRYYAVANDKINVLNPQIDTENPIENLYFRVSSDPDFDGAASQQAHLDTFVTAIPLDSLAYEERYWYQTNTANTDNDWSTSYSFIKSLKSENWLWENTKPVNFEFNGMSYDSNNLIIKLDTLVNSLKLTSAGSSDGKFASMEINGLEKLPNTFFWGIVGIILNPETYLPTDFRYFTFPRTESGDSLITFLNKLPDSTLIALAVCDDAAQSVLGYSPPSAVREAIKRVGSILIDSVRYRESWCIIGKKGAPAGSVPEVYTGQFEGPAIIELSKDFIGEEGTFITPDIGPSAYWNKITIENDRPSGSGIQLTPITFNGENYDTLDMVDVNQNSIPLSFLNTEEVHSARFIITMQSSSDGISPSIKSLGVNYNGVAELGLNYQVVSVQRDTIIQGETNKLNFRVFNVGETSADSFNINVELLKPDNTTKLLERLENVIIPAMDDRMFEMKLTPDYDDGWGNMAFNISVDTDDKILELYEDNNFYSIPFYIEEDTVVTSLSEALLAVTFDGMDINDGDYISPTPSIIIDLTYPSWFSTSDTNAVNFSINGEPVSLSRIMTSNDAVNNQMHYSYNPKFSNGEYVLRVFGKDQSGQTQSIPSYEKMFLVSNELKILDTYNYPNPFRDDTHFTFRLTNVPEELYIKVYTVAGRLIRKLEVDRTNLKTDFNHIPWDGRDEDGDLIANGVYLYRIYAKSGDETFKVTQKLAVVR